MATTHEIRTKIGSVQNTRKITHAMETVAAAKLRKAQQRMAAARPYTEKIRHVVAHMCQAHPEYKHPFLFQREEIRHVGVILVSSDRGLCGGLNTNLVRVALNRIRDWESDGIGVRVCSIGGKGLGIVQRLGMNIASYVTHLGDAPHLDVLIGPVKVMLDAYLEREIESLYIAYNRFINTMKQQATLERILPLRGEDFTQTQEDRWDYIYEPDAKTVVNSLLIRYVEALVYYAVTENMAAEHGARMVSMRSAADNCKSLTDALRLMYNKTRQSAITQELTELVAGAAAL